MRTRRLPGPSHGEDSTDPVWVEETLRPIRRLGAEVDVVPVVMTRIRAVHSSAIPAAPGPTHRTMWTLSLAAGIGMLALAATALAALIVGGDPGPRQALQGLLSLGRDFLVIGQTVLALVGNLFGALLLLLSTLAAAAREAAPLIRGAGAVAAIAGVASIVLSFYVFASARRLAPAAGVEGGAR